MRQIIYIRGEPLTVDGEPSSVVMETAWDVDIDDSEGVITAVYGFSEASLVLASAPPASCPWPRHAD